MCLALVVWPCVRAIEWELSRACCTAARRAATFGPAACSSADGLHAARRCAGRARARASRAHAVRAARRRDCARLPVRA